MVELINEPVQTAHNAEPGRASVVPCAFVEVPGGPLGEDIDDPMAELPEEVLMMY